MSTMLAFNNIENKYILYFGNNCMKKFCESLRKFLLKGKKMLPLTKEELKSHQDAKTCYIFG